MQIICDNWGMELARKLLKEKGLRFTTQKKELLYALKDKPQTVLEILSLLKQKKISIDKVTVYRILTSFVTLGLVREILWSSKEARYELVGGGHHHHLVCEVCGSVEDVELSEDILLREVAKQSEFKIKRHALEFFGICKRCQ